MKDIIYRTYKNNEELVQFLKKKGFKNVVNEYSYTRAEKTNDTLRSQVDEYLFLPCYTSNNPQDPEIVIHEVKWNGQVMYKNVNETGDKIREEILKLK